MNYNEFSICAKLAQKGYRCAIYKGMLILVDELHPPSNSGIDPQPYYTIHGSLPLPRIDIDQLVESGGSPLENYLERSTPLYLIIPSSEELVIFNTKRYE